MRLKRRLVLPALEEHEPQRILRIDTNLMAETPRLRPRTMHMFEADANHLGDSVLSGGDGAADDEHGHFPQTFTKRSFSPGMKIGASGLQRSSAVTRPRVEAIRASATISGLAQTLA